jgi:polyhydroxyalkanoate synthase
MDKTKIPVDLILTKLAEDAEKAQSRVQKASDVLLQDLETGIAQTPYDVVYQEDRVKLKYYRPTSEVNYRRPLLVVYALINRETMLDLQPGRSVVENFAKAGIDLYILIGGIRPARTNSSPLMITSMVIWIMLLILSGKNTVSIKLI